MIWESLFQLFLIGGEMFTGGAGSWDVIECLQRTFQRSVRMSSCDKFESFMVIIGRREILEASIFSGNNFREIKYVVEVT